MGRGRGGENFEHRTSNAERRSEEKEVEEGEKRMRSGWVRSTFWK
jgi:hypothetical protein